jgi:hypothetical protein
MTDDVARGASIGMFVEIQRDIWPQLFDELVHLSKGTARVQRLRTLAYVGLIAERGLGADGAVRLHVASSSGAPTPVLPRGAEGIFDAPLPE